MKFKVLTLFPEMILNGLGSSIIGRATQNNFISVEAINIRDYTQDKHGKVDDYTYGGGAGMLMQAQPVYDAYLAATADCGQQESGQKNRPRCVYVTPQGMPFTQGYAQDLAKEDEVLFLCGHYEGIDARVLEEIVTDYISIGDYVLTGGELPAMVMIDAISRLVPGVLHNEESAETESFQRDLLEYPQFSRPEVWHEKPVPKVLLSGDHKKINAWRLEESVKLTKERRPDLYAKYEAQEKVIAKLSKNKRSNIHIMESLRRGRGEILFSSENALFVYDRRCNLAMFQAQTEEDAKEALRNISERILKSLKSVISNQPFINDLIAKELDIQMQCECKQVCYTQKNPLPVRHKEIRVLDAEALSYVSAHYDIEGACYLQKRIEAKALFGAFEGEKLIGFAGFHTEGSIGMLYVDEAYRHQGIGASLEAYCINRQLELGYVPYGHIRVENEESFRMQEKLGLYCSKDSIWWLENSEK